MAKLPAFQFYTGDWMKDPLLSLCSPAARGVWIDLICAMHELDRSGQLSGTTEQLARAARCSTVELAHALTEFQATGAADVTERNKIVTLVNRRMQAEFKKRLGTRKRVRKHRGNAEETSLLQSSSSDPPNPLGGDDEGGRGRSPPASAVSELADREGFARSFATAWIQTHYPRYYRLHHQFARLILSRGKEAAVDAVEQAIAAGKTINPFGFVETCWTDEEAKASIALKGMGTKAVKDWKEGVLPDGRKQKLTSPPKRPAVDS